MIGRWQRQGSDGCCGLTSNATGASPSSVSARHFLVPARRPLKLRFGDLPCNDLGTAIQLLACALLWLLDEAQLSEMDEELGQARLRAAFRLWTSAVVWR